MANNYTITGDADIIFGTDEVGYTEVGEILSGSQKHGGNMIELKNRKGNTFVTVYFDENDVCEIEAIWDTDFTLPARGDLIDIMGLTDVEVQEYDLKWANESEKKISITCKRYEAKTYPA